ncbi:MAG: HAUS augmin-like complex subunit 5-domain-containing protein [Monoraphidium minutum]|nr:MAG: HAUS augmin-like complex subunit 5-domain-containing protein [Monoraphidium minutum]
MASMEFNSRVVAFLAQLGYQEETPESVATTCKGNLKRIWEFLLENARPAAERRRVDRAVREYQQRQEQDSAAASRAAQAGALRAQLHALRRECDRMERALATQQEELRLQARAVVDESGEAALAEQERRDAELMALTLGCYAQRCSRFAQLIAERRAELQAAAAAARARRDPQQPGGTSGGGGAQGATAARVLEELQELVACVRGEMQQALDGAPDEVAGAAGAPPPPPSGLDPRFDGGGSGGAARRRGGARARLVAGHAPSPDLADRLRALQGRPPAALLACACALAERSVSRLRALLAGGEAAAAAANAAVAQLPREVKERRALMPWTTSAADAALAEGGGLEGGDLEGGGGDACKGGRPDADELIRQRQQAHVRLFLDARGAGKAAAAARVRLEAALLRPELAELQRGEEGRAAAGLWLGVQTKRAQVAALAALQAQLLGELATRQDAEAALRGKWGQITEYMAEYQRQAALLCYLSADSVALSGDLGAQAREARSALSGALAPRCRAARDAARGARGGAAREAAAAARVPLRAAVAGAPGGLLAGPTAARFRLAAQHLCRAGAGPTPAAAASAGPEGAAAGGGATAGAAVPAGAGPGVLDPAMAAALEAACEVDDLAPLKCPAELMAGVIDGTRRLCEQQQLLSTLGEQLSAAAARLAAGRADAARLRAAAGELRAADASARLPLLQEALAEGRAAREFADGAARAALTDWWQQPAQHLVPSVTYEGRNCSEWLIELQALHGRQRELSGGGAA